MTFSKIKIEEAFGKLALSLQRPPDENPQLESKFAIGFKVLFLAAIGFFLISIYCQTNRVLPNRWEKTPAEFPLPVNVEWKALYDVENAPCVKSTSHPDCLADPSIGDLWNSSFRRADIGQHVAKTSKRRGKTFFLGLELPASYLQQSATKHANYFWVGSINGGYRVWIDGELLFDSQGKSTLLSLAFPIPFSKLSTSRSIKIAIEITHNTSYVYPDYFLGPGFQGFSASAAGAEKLVGTLFNNEERYALFTLLYLAVSLLFAFFWTVATPKQEYWYLAALALNQAVLWIFGIRTVGLSWPTGTNVHWIRLPFSLLEGALGLLLGLSFARTGASTMRFCIFFTGVLTCYLMATVRSPETLLQIDGILEQYWVPATYGLGASACLLQAWYLSKSPSLADRTRKRKSRLIWFSSLLFSIGILYLFESHLETVRGDTAVFFFSTNFFAVLLMSAILLLDYRNDLQFFESMEVPDFIRNGSARLEGVMVRFDLKNSTELELPMNYDDFLEKWQDAVLPELWKNRGCKLLGAGDEIIAFFEGADVNGCFENAFRALSAIQRAQNEFSRSCGILESIYFRAAVCDSVLLGSIQDVRATKRASYKSPAYKDTARILKLEEAIPDNELRSLVLIEKRNVSDSLLETIETHASMFVENFQKPDKNKVVRDLIVLEVKPEPTVAKSEAKLSAA
jgi:hypothetical protein